MSSFANEVDFDNVEPAARIIVIGVGGAGNNAVNRMIDENIANVEFYVMNTDRQALATSKAPNRFVLGKDITQGLGAGGDPEVGKKAAESSADEIREILKGAHMVFIAAGMGGGTGTGAAPVIAQIARELGVLTVAIVTRPFTFEGKSRLTNSINGLNELKDAVDSIIIVSNDKLLMASGNTMISNSFAESDRVLAQSVKTITDIIFLPALINRDFADVRNVLKNGGISLIGFGMGTGRNKAQEAAENALNSPLLEASIAGARKAICQVTCGKGVSLYDAEECARRIAEQAGGNLDFKFGVSINENLDDTMLVSVVASDFSSEYNFNEVPEYKRPVRNETETAAPKEGESAPKETSKETPSNGWDDIMPDWLKKDF